MTDQDGPAYLKIEFYEHTSWTYKLAMENCSAQQLWGIIPVLQNIADELYQRQLDAMAADEASKHAERAEIITVAKSIRKVD